MNSRISTDTKIICLFLFLFFITRIPFLDADAPHWSLFNYDPLDSAYYNLAALHLYNFGSLNNIFIEGISGTGSNVNLIGNLFTYCSLLIFGNNFWGLRCGYLVLTSIGFYFFLKILESIFRPQIENHKEFRIVQTLLAILYIFSPSQVWSSIMSEPTAVRLTSLLFVIWIFQKSFFIRRQYLIMFLSTLAIGLVYPTNLFILPASFLLLLVGVNESSTPIKVQWHRLVFLISATAFGFVTCYIFNLLMSGRMDKLSESEFLGRIWFPPALQKIFLISYSSIFRDNVVFPLILATIPAFLITNLREFYNRNKRWLFFLVFLLFQTLFINDYPARKGLIFHPFLLLLTGYVFIFIKNLKNRSWPIFWSFLFFGIMFSWSHIENWLNFPIAYFYFYIILFSIGALVLILWQMVPSLNRFLGLSVIASLICFSQISEYFVNLTNRTYALDDCQNKLTKIIPVDSFVFGLSHGLMINQKWNPMSNVYLYDIKYPEKKQDEDASLVFSQHPDKVFRIGYDNDKQKINPEIWKKLESFPYCLLPVYVKTEHYRNSGLAVYQMVSPLKK